MPPQADEVGEQAVDSRALRALAFTWGACAFFPVGVVYLNLLLMLAALSLAPGLRGRLAGLRRRDVFLPVLLLAAWTTLVAVVGGWFPDTPTRLFHVFRVSLVLFIGLLLTPTEARAALAGFLLAAVLAALVVAVHHVWVLPAWDIWGSLLVSRNNFSSGNMITMATASGVCFLLGASRSLVRGDRWLALAAGLALAVTVAFHAVSRNSQLLVVVLLLTAVYCRFRSMRSVVAGAAAVVVLATTLWHFSPNTKSRFLELADNLHHATQQADYGSSGGVRWRMNQEAFRGMLENPWMGAGVGSWLPHWRTAWTELDAKSPPGSKRPFSEINNPHNDFLLAGMETGVAGMLLMVWLLLRFVRQGWQQRSVAGSITVVMGVGMFADTLVNAPFRDAALGMTLLWLLAVSVAAQEATPHA